MAELGECIRVKVDREQVLMCPGNQNTVDLQLHVSESELEYSSQDACNIEILTYPNSPQIWLVFFQILRVFFF